MHKGITMTSIMRYIGAVCLAAITAAYTSRVTYDRHVEHHQDTGSSALERAYLAENDAAMSKMMTDMEAKPTGDIDRQFITMMTPHHQGAIDMAVAFLKYGKNVKLKRIAQEIIVEQQQEIKAMMIAVGDPIGPSSAAPTQAEHRRFISLPAAQ